MSIVFDGSGNLTYASDPLGTDYPGSMAFWFKADDETLVQTLMRLYGFNIVYINFSESVSGKVDMWHNIAGPGWTGATPSNAIVADSWNQLIYIRASDASQKVILNGGTAAEDTTASRAWGTFSSGIEIGHGIYNGNFTGKIAEIAFWQGHALTTDEITDLQTLYPDATDTAPDIYIPGLSDAASEIGASFTATDLTYSSGDHPSLSAGATGALALHASRYTSLHPMNPMRGI
jgi:hypothetical protein